MARRVKLGTVAVDSDPVLHNQTLLHDWPPRTPPNRIWCAG
jgi:hypothetical protein